MKFLIYTLVGVGLGFLFVASANKSTFKYKTKLVKFSLGGAVAIPFILYWFDPVGSFEIDSCTLKTRQTSLTVFVHGKGGKHEMILRQKGTVILDLNGGRTSASINELGEAFFQNLHYGDRIRLNIDFSEPYESTHPDSIYTVELNGQIYLEVYLKGIDRVSGSVFSQDAPLPGVAINVDTLSTTSDSNGRFTIHIPEEMQRKSYEVQFNKKGFASKIEITFPETGKNMEVILQKKLC